MNLETLHNETLLLLGKPRAFSEAEFAGQLEAHTISVSKELRDDIKIVLEGRMMTPYEQNLSDALYEKGGYSFVAIDAFEKALAAKIDDDVLLMSLKLSNDKDRLKSFLQNSCVSDTLFFKLLKMYRWQGEDFFENDDNRDVSAALIGRFYENIERNHNVQYATTGLIHLVSQTKNPKLLEAISALEPLKFHPKLTALLAQHPHTPKSVLQRFFRTDERDVLLALSQNSALMKDIALKLLEKDAVFAQNIAQSVKIDAALFSALLPYAAALAHNESLDAKMQEALFALGAEEVLEGLAQNSSLIKPLQEKLLAVQNEKLMQLLLGNSALDAALLKEAFLDAKNHPALAKNPALEAVMLRALYESGEEAVLEALARNTNTPIDILYQLQLDRRFERAVKTNEAFGKAIQSQNIGWLV